MPLLKLLKGKFYPISLQGVNCFNYIDIQKYGWDDRPMESRVCAAGVMEMVGGSKGEVLNCTFLKKNLTAFLNSQKEKIEANENELILSWHEEVGKLFPAYAELVRIKTNEVSYDVGINVKEIRKRFQPRKLFSNFLARFVILSRIPAEFPPYMVAFHYLTEIQGLKKSHAFFLAPSIKMSEHDGFHGNTNHFYMNPTHFAKKLPRKTIKNPDLFSDPESSVFNFFSEEPTRLYDTLEAALDRKKEI